LIAENSIEYDSLMNKRMDEFYYLLYARLKKSGHKSEAQKEDDWLNFRD
jgi:hypothetical protein